ncbi:MAG: LysR substrate-binding domain-containing protein [Cyanobacteria bacterium P01_F01_bin.13]
MLITQLTKPVLRRYLRALPYQTRLVRYGALINVRWLKSALEEIKPDVLPDELSDLIAQEPAPELVKPPVAHYHQYRCLQNNPLSCYEPTAKEQTTCQHCYFPALLPEGGRLIGKQGQYKIGRSLGRRGIGRLYEGIRLSSEEPVIIQEYLLPGKYFSSEEQKQYQESFTNLAGLSLADGRVQDARIVLPLEAIADSSSERCYLVTSAADKNPTLNRYCAKYGSLDSKTVLSILNQVLQTLVFLHQQKFVLPAGQVEEGIIHGNLSLDSLLWVTVPKVSDGFVYLTDFALWERLFDPALVDRGQPNYQDDLAALGEVAFYLLNGATVDRQGQSLKPHLDSDWPDTYPPLKQFILRLLGIDPPFASAEAARSALLVIPPEAAINQWEHRPEEYLPVRQAWYKRWVPMLVMAAILATLGGIGWLLLRSQRSYANTPLPPCCLEDIDAVPQGAYGYAIPTSAYWHRLFRVSTQTSPETLPTLFDQLQTLHPELSLVPQVTDSVEAAIASVQSGQTDVAIIPLTTPLPPDITSTIIAYDSLVPVVAFNYPDRTKGLPEALRGEISLSQLEQLYTGDIDNWQRLSSVDLNVKRYWVNDPTVQQFFAQQVFTTAEQPRSDIVDTSSFITPINIEETDALPTLTMLRWILQDFENSTIGSIGIAPLSQVFGQCSVYPLALGDAKQDAKQSVAPLVFTNGKAIGPESDLCDRKGSYQPNAQALRNTTYPLAYPLAVIYPFDNSRSPIGKKLAELLLTQESQTHLTSRGMVSAYPLSGSQESP